jgi:hypothetical protein
MSQDQNARIAGALLAALGTGASADEIAGLFSADVRPHARRHAVVMCPTNGSQTCVAPSSGTPI